MDKDEWQRLYDAAPSIRALAKDLGVSPSGLARKLKGMGIQARIQRPSRPKPAPTPEACAEWRRLYEEAGSALELARRLGKAHGTITYHLKRHGIDVRTSGYQAPKTVRHYGPDHGSWKGGTYRHSDGYVYEYAPNHPDAGPAKGYVLQHRLVMEAKLGRRLSPSELVHHINEVKDDNRPENLEIHNRSTHMKHHKQGAERDRNGRFLE